METMKAFEMGKKNRDKEPMVFDWNKAAQLIKESGYQDASAGLRGDWEFTGGKIFQGKKIVSLDETYVYLASTWAIPEIKINGIVTPCFKMKSETDHWHAGTYWPKSAIDILGC